MFNSITGLGFAVKIVLNLEDYLKLQQEFVFAFYFTQFNLLLYMIQVVFAVICLDKLNQSTLKKFIRANDFLNYFNPIFTISSLLLFVYFEENFMEGSGLIFKSMLKFMMVFRVLQSIINIYTIFSEDEENNSGDRNESQQVKV